MSEGEMDAKDDLEAARRLRESVERIRQELGKVIVGQ